MKTFRSLFVLTSLALSFSLSAANNPDAELRFTSQVVDQNAVILHLVNLQKHATKISIESLDGETTFFEELVMKHNGYRLKVNLQNLADGRYLIQVKQGDVSMNQVMLIRNRVIQLSAISE